MHEREYISRVILYMFHVLLSDSFTSVDSECLFEAVKSEGDWVHNLVLSFWICNIYCTQDGKNLCHDIKNNHIVTFFSVNFAPFHSFLFTQIVNA